MGLRVLEASGAERSTYIKVRVTTRAAKRSLRIAADGTVKVALNSPPIDGKANRELIAFIARRLKVPKSGVQLAHGDKSRDKLLRITGLDRERIEARLARFPGATQ